jgi:O-antigen ligase
MPPPVNPPQNHNFTDPLLWSFAALVSGLVFVRWWQPTEGTLLGDTLGIVLGWFALLAWLGWIVLRGTVWTLKLDRLQWAVWLLAGGHLLSGILILVTSGDKRAAMNLIWEWLGLAIAFPLLRALLATSAARREWTVVAIAGVLTLSSYGLMQRAYVYPRMIAEYQKVREELDAIELDLKEHPEANQNYQTQSQILNLQTKLIRQGVQPHMLSGASRVMFEGRLLHSTEVLGRFALANTFAGLLLVWWIVLAVQTVTQIRAGFDLSKRDTVDLPSHPLQERHRVYQILKIAFLGLCLLVIGYCLLLTKSRTAYIGSLVSLGVWSLLVALKSSLQGRRAVRWLLAMLAAIAVLILLVLCAVALGGLDRLVLAEAPKSLQYRLEYWWSSLQVIREAPLLGTGPGQFRQHYLAHKLPRSSEEIADPHNLILDVWANGGLLALVGLALVSFEIARSGFSVISSVIEYVRNPIADRATVAPAAPEPKSHSVIPIGPKVRDATHSGAVIKKIAPLQIPHSGDAGRTGIEISELSASLPVGWMNPIRVGALCSLVCLWFIGGAVETTLWLLIGSWAVSIGLLDRVLPRTAPMMECGVAAGCGLLVHLLGAGGIAMPAITQLLVLLAVFCQRIQEAGEIVEEWPSPESIALLKTMRETTVVAELSGESRSRSSLQSLRGGRVRISSLTGGAMTVLGLALFAICFMTAARPVWLSLVALEQAELTNSLPKRQQLLRRAAADDPLSAEPWEKLAAGEFRKWRSATKPDDRDFKEAIVAQRTAIERNPLAYHGYRTLGEFYLERARRTGSVEDKHEAVAALKIAMQRYPNQAELAVVAATAFKVAGEQELMVQTARRAVAQDDINHAALHTDKWLTPETRQRIEELAKSAGQE